MKTSEQTSEIFAALAKAQAVMGSAKKDSANPFFKSKYADLAEVMDTARKPLGDNGLALLQEATNDTEHVLITTRVVHASGQWMEFGPLSIIPGKRDAQGVVAAVTYGRRAAAQAALGMAAEDDDGNSTHQQGPKVQTGQAAREAVEKVFATKLPPPASAPVVTLPESAYLPSMREPGDDSEPSPVVPFGKNKGMKLSELSEKQLVWYFNAATENVADPAKEKYRAKEQVWLNAISEEMGKRGGA